MRPGFVAQLRPALQRAGLACSRGGLRKPLMVALTVSMSLPPGSRSIKARFPSQRAVQTDIPAAAFLGASELLGADGVFQSLNTKHFVLTDEGVLRIKKSGHYPCTFTAELATLPAGVKILALRRMRLWWMAPWWGSSTDSLPEETQFMLVKLPNSGGEAHGQPFAAIIPLVDSSYRSTLSGGRGGRLSVTIESGSDHVTLDREIDVALVARGSDPYATLKSAFDLASARLGTFRTLEHKKAPPILDWFGWCTWDAFYFKVHGEGIRQGLKSLSEGGTPAKMLIIDDGWQNVKTDAKYDQSTTTIPTKKRLLANVFQLIQSSINKYYKKFVFHAPLGSLHLKVFRLLSSTFLKTPLMFWTAENEPGSKRLVSPEASRRFLNTLGGRSGSLHHDVSKLTTFIRPSPPS